jgi:signal transduction histidine kinase
MGLQHILNRSEAEKKSGELQKSHDMLEHKIHERTQDLAKAIDELKSQISHRMETEEQLISHRQKLRSLYAHLHSLREEERTRIAREIHDELGQVLTALKMDLAWTKAHIPKELKTLLEKTDANLELVDRTIQTIKRIITELRPGILDHLGLGAAIEWQLAEFRKRTGIACHVKIEPPDLSIEPTISIALFRIFQEALTNVTRHANATVVKALLRQDAHEIRLEVADNGIGISKEQLSQPKSFGLMGMRERVHQLSGEIRISGKLGSGTVLNVTIPLTGSLYDR